MRVVPVVAGISWFVFVTAVSLAVNSVAAPPRSRITVERHALPLPPPRPDVEPSTSYAPAAPSEVAETPVSAAALSEPLPASVPESEPALKTTDLSPAPPVPPDSSEPAPVVADWRRKSDARSTARALAPPAAPVAAALSPTAAPSVEAQPPEKKRRVSRRAGTTPAAELPDIPGDPMGVCLICGARADSWTEVDGQRVGYCRKHLTKAAPVPPAPRETATTAEPSAEPAPRSERRTASSETGSTSIQCRGVTKSGTRCRRKTSDPSGLCYQHRGQAGL